MQIIKYLATNVVIFAGNALAISGGACIGTGWTFNKLDVTLLTVETVDSIPDGFVGGGWTYVDGTWTVNAIGEQALLPVKRNEKIEQFSALAAAENYADIDYLTWTWRADAQSRALLAQVLAVGSVPVDMYWRDSSDVSHAMTYSDLQGLGLAILTRGLAIDQNLTSKTAAINAATSVAEVEAITWE